MSRTIEELTKENDVLRGLLPKLNAPCVHCGLEEIGRCARGFPGCATADDLFLADETMCGDVLKRLREAERLADARLGVLNQIHAALSGATGMTTDGRNWQRMVVGLVDMLEAAGKRRVELEVALSKTRAAALALDEAVWSAQDWNRTHVGDCSEALTEVIEGRL